jgi:protein involved in polysaccharide export with SLBB domain
MREMLLITGFLILAVVGPGCSGTLSRNKEATASEPVFAELPKVTSAPDNPEVDFEKMRPGDEIVINFAKPDGKQFSFAGKVRDDGTITLVSNKVFNAAGKTAREFEKDVFCFYGPSLYQTVVTDPPPYFVAGEVKTPGKQPFMGPITVLQAIESAGGFTDRAMKRKVKVVRGDGRLLFVNCFEAADARLDVQVYPGDRIFVPKRLR